MRLHFEPNLDYQLQAIEAVCDLFQGDELLKSLNSRDFTVEMETGTGKTYVYLRTLFELNKRFGFTKFVIVVPSIAIKEGVYKSLQVMEDHFRGLYSGAPFDYFLYDSSRLGRVRNFAVSPGIQVMLVTVGAINKKDINTLYKESEETGGEKPIDLIRAIRPIVVVDEPQTVDGGLTGRGKEALDLMSPLCTLRYSATHIDKHHMVFRLDAVDAFERKLVKQVEVASATVEDAHNRPYARLVSVSSRDGSVSARVELDVQEDGGVRRREVTVKDGDDLQQRTRRAVYRGCRIGEIRAGKGRESVELLTPGGLHDLKPGEAVGGVEALAVQRQMIRRTILEHLDKEKRLRPLGIKVLSLFFVDAVDKYRRYDDEGNPHKGDYARIFEEEYAKCAEVDLSRAIEEAHGGYFSIDRRRVGGKAVEVLQDTKGDSKADDDTYNLIMKDKERLLSFETPLRFIFSHSALREGWDNPNVFQICVLRDIQAERERRQTIGRGLRLCVNQQGERVRGDDINTLTIIATERYEEFAEKLQQEYADIGIRFEGVEIRNADERRPAGAGPAKPYNAEHKASPRLEFDNEELIASCIRAVREAPGMLEARLQWRKVELAIRKSGIEASGPQAGESAVIHDDGDGELPDLLTELEARTRLTRRTIHRVLVESGRLEDFTRNPRQFIELVAEAINGCKRERLATTG